MNPVLTPTVIGLLIASVASLLLLLRLMRRWDEADASVETARQLVRELSELIRFQKR